MVSQDDLSALMATSSAGCSIDFTHAEVAARIAEQIIQAGARPVIGTTGFTSAEIASLQKLAEAR